MEQPKDNSKFNKPDEIMDAHTKECRGLWLSRGSGANNGIPFYGFVADGLFAATGKESGKGGSLSPMQARPKLIRWADGYEALMEMWRKGDYLGFYKSFNLEGDDLLTLLNNRKRLD